MTAGTVIVFGPTGSVGSAAARTAHANGAKVYLAMRDTSKTIPGLSKEEEIAGGYERVTADLTQPETLRAAVIASGASHAFIYVAMQGSSDHMRAGAEALKAAGIKFVVLLSSMSVHGDIRAVPPTDFIAFKHAQVEVSLEEVFGVQGYVAVRPAFFASNSFWWAKQIIEDAEVKSGFPEVKFDYITPEDIGAVCGTILVSGSPGENVVTLMGPEMASTYDAIEVIGKAIGKEVKVTKVGEEEHLQIMVTKCGVPEPVAKILTQQIAHMDDTEGFLKMPGSDEARANIEKYLKRPPMRFSEWLQHNKDKFEA